MPPAASDLYAANAVNMMMQQPGNRPSSYEQQIIDRARDVSPAVAPLPPAPKLSRALSDSLPRRRCNPKC